MDVRWRNFIWDADKARANLRNHGVSFQEGAWATYDSHAIVGEDELHSGSERRQWLLGQSPRKRILLVIFTLREDNLTRIISVWKASKEDQKLYDEETAR
jgi:hypothetical protein